MAKSGTGSKASKRADAQPDAQIERANSTSAMFLGNAGTRSYSWMTGDLNQTPRSNPATTASNAPDAAENQIQEQSPKRGHALQRDRPKSTSNSPQIANMAVPSQAPSDSNAPSPPPTPNPDPQLRDETPVHVDESGNGRKRSSAGINPFPKRRRIEDDSQDASFRQQQVNKVRRLSSNRAGLGLGQQEQGDHILRNTLAGMHARLQMPQSQSPVVVQSPNFSNASMPPPPASSAALSNRRTSGSPAIQQGPWEASPRQSVSQFPNLGHRQVQAAPPAPSNVLSSKSPRVEIVMQGLEQFLFVDIFSLHPPYESKGCRSILEAYIASRGGLDNLGPTARLRLQVLQTAVAECDWLFQFIHHIISAYCHLPGFVPSAIAAIPGFQAAVNIINMILGSAQLDDPGMMMFFAAFPCQLGLSLSFSLTKDDGLAYLKQFLPELPQLWRTLENECRQRQYPPTIPELVGYMKVLSPTLMRIFFTAARRVAWPCSPEQESGAEMTNIFGEADFTFARARSIFLSQFQNYQLKDEIQEYLRLQRIYLHLRQSLSNQNQLNEMQQGQGQSIRRQPGVPQQVHIQQAQLVHAQLQIQRQQGQQRQMGPNQRQRLVTGRPVQFNPNVIATPNLQVDTGRPSLQQPSRHNNALSTTSLGNHPLGILGVPSPIGNQGSPNGQSLSPSYFNGQPMSGNTAASRNRAQQALTVAGRFMPALNDPPPPQPAVPNPQMSALHQAHLREPMLVQPPRASDESALPNLYQMVSHYLLPPKRLASGSRVQEWKFDLHEGEHEHIALIMPSGIEGQRSTRIVAEGSYQYRLRCSKMSPSIQAIKAKDWAVSDTSFPTNMYMVVDGHDLEVRRKLHHGKDLPIDITDHLKSGPNTLEFFLNPGPDDLDASNYVFAIETVGVKSEETIIKECQKREREAEEVLTTIKNCLNGAGSAVDNEDDDLIMVSSTITIDLVDPITQNTTLTIPVRGLDCTHWSCFDLPAFIQSRMFQDPGISAVDVWRCPICRGDARPQSLIIDGFILEARKKLDQDGKQEVRAIIVEADGSWRPKPEKIKEDGPSPQSRQTTLSASSHQGSAVQHSSITTESQTEQPLAPIRLNAAPKKPVQIVDLGSDTD